MHTETFGNLSGKIHIEISFLRTIHLSPELIWHPILSVINELNEFSIFDERLNKVEIDNEGNEASKNSLNG